ncbi:MAG: hypothetical protein ACRDOH_25810 [Streptosporangiaceae bacterium]
MFPEGDWHARRPNNDGEIIDQALAVQELTGDHVILAACDHTQLYRAGLAGLTAVLMTRPEHSKVAATASADAQSAL